MNLNSKLHYGFIGTGPIGSTFAVHLKQSGHRVGLLCVDDARLQAIRNNLFKVHGALTASATFDELYTDLGNFLNSDPDVIFIATKSSDSQAIINRIKSLKPESKTLFVSCQNGLDVENQVSDTLGPNRSLRMVINIGASLTNDTDVKVIFSHTQFLSIRKEVNEETTQSIVLDLNRSGIKTEATALYRVEVFKKAILNASLASVCALTSSTMRGAMEDRELSQIVLNIVKEGMQVAKAEGAALPPQFIDYALDYFSKGGDHKPSLLMDIESHRHTENEYHCGKICEYARKNGIQVPVTQTIYYLLKNLEKRVTQIH